MKAIIQPIASAYGISRQRLHTLKRRCELGLTDLKNPDRVFDRLLEKEITSPLRFRLADPKERLRITKLLNQ